MRKYIFIVCALLFVGNINAQKKWTLRQCIDYAVENNLEIKQQKLNMENTEITLSTSKNSRLPDLSASAGQSFNFGRSPSPLTGMYEDNQSTSTSFGLSAGIPIFTGFRISNEIKSNELNLLAATEGLKKAKDNLELQVTSYYLDALFKKEILKVYEEQVLLTTEQITRTQALVDGGKVPLSQLYDIKAQLARDELSTTNTKNDLTLSILNLSQTLNLTDNTDFDIETPYMDDDVIGNNISSIIPPNQVYEEAIAIKPHVKEVEYKLEGSKKDLKIAQSGHWPTINLGMSHSMGYSHIFNYESANPDSKQQSFSSQLKNSSRQYIGLNMNVPIFNRFATRNNVRKARLNIESRALELDNVKLALYKEIQQAYQSAVAAQAKYKSTEKAYDSAKESLKYAEERYDVGKLTVFEFNEARVKLLSSQSEQIQSKYDFLFRAKILDFYRGLEIDIK